MAISITKKTGTANTTASAGRTIKYICIHYTAGVSSTSGKAASTAAWFADSSAGASADFIVDDENVVQYNPDPENRYCWAVGGSKQSTKGGSLYGTAKNANSISIEICSTNSAGKVADANDKTWSFTDAVVAKAVELTQYLMEKYSIDTDHVIRHYDVTGKLCVPTYSEVLTHEGWKRIDEVEIGEEIACADLDGLNVSFEEVYDKVPVKYQSTYTNCGLTATIDHRMVYSDYKHKEMYRIDKYGNLLSSPSQVYIPLAGHSKFEGLPITDDMLEFYVAVQADGHYMYERNKAGEKRYYGLEFHFSKQRKIDRIKEIFDSIKLNYTETTQSDGTTKIRAYNTDEYNIVNDVCERYLKDKEFTWEWINLSREQAELFLSEIQLWDGCAAGNLYTSKSKQNLDVISAIAVMNGVGSKVSGSNVMFTEQPYMVLGRLESSTKRNKDHNRQTEVTCVSVKTGIFLMRQNGKTFVVGNCPGIIGWNADSGNEDQWKAFQTAIASGTADTDTAASGTVLYRVRKTWADASSQIGAYSSLDNAKAVADANSGYYVFDPDGNSIYPFTPYTVKVIIDNLNIRNAPNGEKIGKFTGKGTFTIVDESDGWGLLKAYQTNRDGWISLDYATKV